MEPTSIVSESSTTLFYAQLLIAIFALGLGALLSILSIPLQKGAYAVIGLLFLTIGIAAVFSMDFSKLGSLSESLDYFGQFATFGVVMVIFSAFIAFGVFAITGGDKK